MARAKRHEEEEHENHERWLVTYADMITLLMVLFIVLFSMATIDAHKFNALKNSLAGVKQPKASVLDGSPSVIDGGQIQKLDTTPPASQPQMDTPTLPQLFDPSAAKLALQQQQAQAAAEAKEQSNLKQVQEEIQASLQAHGDTSDVNFVINQRGLVVSIVTDKVLFDSGQATLKPQSDDILTAIGEPLAHLPNEVSIEGYTDNQPISTPQYPSNWELSTARATSVLRFMVDHGYVAPQRAGATGYGEFRPAVANDSDAHRAQNRRVEVVVLDNANPAVTNTLPTTAGA